MGLLRKQVDYLLQPIAPQRVLKVRGQSYVAQQDIRAQMNRVFGFAGWSTDVLSTDFMWEEQDENKRWKACYRATVRVTLLDPVEPHKELAHYTDSHASGNAPQPDRAEAHALALTTAVSTAFKRACTNLGDQFGLSLYNRGQTTAFVKGTLILPDDDGSITLLPMEEAEVTDLGDEGPQAPETAPSSTVEALSKRGEAMSKELARARDLDSADRIVEVARLKTEYADVVHERLTVRGAVVTLDRLADTVANGALE